MNRISKTFKKLGEKGEKALVTFITAGDPDMASTAEMITELEKAGADVIELGMPFSDPMADGPTIQLSSERALAAGATLPGILDAVKSARRDTDIPIILMGYYNPIFLYGMERFAEDAAAAGVDGVLLVDLPPEESEAEGFTRTARKHGLDVIFLLAPTSGDDRIEKVIRLGRGFLYYVSVTGVTGARKDVSSSLREEVSKIRERSTLPVVVGFGISDPDQAGEVALISDGVVVGSALVKYFEKYRGSELREKVADFVSSLKAGIKSAAASRK
ncbi:MAG TPA: tryptophan synthase subunit alpha [Geobacteraceae bacterium]|nr:tryptophan synthase subunit alpha [Geobacteraceae bacterium]